MNKYTCILRRLTKSNFKKKLSFRKKFKITYRQERNKYKKHGRWGEEGRETVHLQLENSSLITRTPGTNSKIFHKQLRILIAPLSVVSSHHLCGAKDPESTKKHRHQIPSLCCLLITPFSSYLELLGSTYTTRFLSLFCCSFQSSPPTWSSSVLHTPLGFFLCFAASLKTQFGQSSAPCLCMGSLQSFLILIDSEICPSLFQTTPSTNTQLYRLLAYTFLSQSTSRKRPPQFPP